MTAGASIPYSPPLAGVQESTEARERAERCESTGRTERAGLIESTEGQERAAQCESTECTERAVPEDSAAPRERAAPVESTVHCERRGAYRPLSRCGRSAIG